MKPFSGASEYLTFQKIIKCDYDFPSNFPSNEARDLIEELLKLDPRQRIGFGTKRDELRAHAFFSDVKWDNLLNVESSLLV